MFGERYFATREPLFDVMRGITDLAVETGIHPDECLEFPQAKSLSDSPFLVVVQGEANSGKSTLLNALFENSIYQERPVPKTDRVLWYLHGDTARDEPVDPLLEKRHLPLGFLRNFNLVDTPGINSLSPAHAEIINRFVAQADLILFVFPVSNPWNAPTWDAISRLPVDALKRTALILQQADQREPNDIAVIRGHMADLSMKRLGQSPPIYAVAGQLASEAKQTTPRAWQALTASGFPALEEFVSNNICLAPARRQALERWRDQAVTALGIVEDHIEEQSREIQSRAQFMEQIEREIGRLREPFVTRLSEPLEEIAAVFEREGILATRRLRRRLWTLPSLFRLFTGDRTGTQIETLFSERLLTAVESVAEQDVLEVADVCLAHWNTLGDRVHAAIGLNLEPETPIIEMLAAAKQRFVQRLGEAAKNGISNLKVRNPLEKELRRRNLALKSFVFMTLMLTIVGATCGALVIPWLPVIFCALATLFLTGAFMTSWVTRAAITGDFQNRLLDSNEAFTGALQSDYDEVVHRVFRDYSVSLDPVRHHLAQETLAIVPRKQRWQELFLTLKAIEQEW